MTLDSVELGGPMTIALWARWDALNDWSRLIDFGDGQDDSIIIATRTNFARIVANIRIGEKVEGDSNVAEVVAGTITLGEWTHVAFTVEGSDIILYQDGVQVHNITTGHEPNVITRSNHYVGKSNFSADSFFKGAISSLQIWDRALSASEVKAFYNRGRFDEPFPLINNRGGLDEQYPLINAITNNITVNPLQEINIYTSLTNPNYLNDLNFDISCSPPLSTHSDAPLTIDQDTGQISGTPDWNSAGDYVITVTVNDITSGVSKVETINLKVKEAYGLATFAGKSRG